MINQDLSASVVPLGFRQMFNRFIGWFSVGNVEVKGLVFGFVLGF